MLVVLVGFALVANLAVRLLAELLDQLALGQVVVDCDPLARLPFLARLPMEARPRDVIQHNALRHDLRPELAFLYLGLVAHPRHANSGQQEVSDDRIRL